MRARRTGIPGGLAAAAMLCAVPAYAQDFDELSEADELMQQAQDAADAGDWGEARRLAEIVLGLDDSYATAPARLVLVQALEQEGARDSALYEIRRYLELPLDDAARRNGERLERKLAKAVEGSSGSSALTGSTRGPGIGLLIGGAAPVVAGGWLLGTDIRYATEGTDSGTWAAIGTPVLITGVALEVVGAVLLGTANKTTASTFEAMPTFAADPRTGTAVLGLGGRF